MASDFLKNFLSSGNIPNRFTQGMGKLIKDARLDAKLTQKELASQAYMKQSTLSKAENGLVEVTASDLFYLANSLKKPIMYFFPKPLIRHLYPEERKGDKSMDELFLVSKRLGDDELKRVIAQIRALVDYDERKYSKDWDEE